jgi:hypothetical protein
MALMTQVGRHVGKGGRRVRVQRQGMGFYRQADQLEGTWSP